MANPQWRKNVRAFVWRRDKGLCQICGRRIASITEMTLDHIQPKSKGGKNTRENLRATCFTCNNRRGNDDPPWLQRAKWDRAKRRLLRASPAERLTTDERIAIQKRAEP